MMSHFPHSRFRLSYKQFCAFLDSSARVTLIKSECPEPEDENGKLKTNIESEYRINKIRKAAVATISALSVKAKLFANNEEEQIRQLVVLLIDLQSFALSCSRVRTSSGMFLKRDGDKIIRNIETRIADYTFIPADRPFAVCIDPRNQADLEYEQEDATKRRMRLKLNTMFGIRLLVLKWERSVAGSFNYKQKISLPLC